MKNSDKKNLEFDWSKLTLPQNKATTNTHDNMEENNEFRKEGYLGEIQFGDDPKYYNFFISQDISRVLLVSTNLDYKAENKYQKEYISNTEADDFRFEAIIALIKNNSRSEKNSSDFKTFLDAETGIQLEYRFLAHDGFKKETVNSILESIKPKINYDNNDVNKIGTPGKKLLDELTRIGAIPNNGENTGNNTIDPSSRPSSQPNLPNRDRSRLKLK